MTRDEMLNITAGKELDVLVAERVFGYEPGNCPHVLDDKVRRVYLNVTCGGKMGTWTRKLTFRKSHSKKLAGGFVSNLVSRGSM